jgi:nucleoside 2-deoxyribosyltransferase
MKLIYIAGPYGEYVSKQGNVHTVAMNIKQAQVIAGELWKLGYAVIAPHLNTANFDIMYPKIERFVYLRGDLEIVGRCDAVVMTPDYKYSMGAVAEMAYAFAEHVEVYLFPHLDTPLREKQLI